MQYAELIITSRLKILKGVINFIRKYGVINLHLRYLVSAMTIATRFHSIVIRIFQATVSMDTSFLLFHMFCVNVLLQRNLQHNL